MSGDPSPAPSAETERAVEVAAGLTPFEAQLVLAIQRLSDLGVLRGALNGSGDIENALPPFGRLVARSLAGEG